MDSEIFKFRNLTDFEKNLYLSRQVKDLKAELKKKDLQIGQLKSTVDELEYNARESLRVKNLQLLVRGLEKKKRMWEEKYHACMQKLNEPLRKD